MSCLVCVCVCVCVCVYVRMCVCVCARARARACVCLSLSLSLCMVSLFRATARCARSSPFRTAQRCLPPRAPRPGEVASCFPALRALYLPVPRPDGCGVDELAECKAALEGDHRTAALVHVGAALGPHDVARVGRTFVECVPVSPVGVAVRAAQPAPAIRRRRSPFARGSPRGLALSFALSRSRSLARSLSFALTRQVPSSPPLFFSCSRLHHRFLLSLFVRSVFRVATTSIAAHSYGGQLDLRAFDALDDAALGELAAHWPAHTSIFVANESKVSAAAKEEYGCSEPLFDDAETAKFFALFRKYDANQSGTIDARELKVRLSSRF